MHVRGDVTVGEAAEEVEDKNTGFRETESDNFTLTMTVNSLQCVLPGLPLCDVFTCIYVGDATISTSAPTSTVLYAITCIWT